MTDTELETILMLGYGYKPERDAWGEVQWRKGNPCLPLNPLNRDASEATL